MAPNPDPRLTEAAYQGAALEVDRDFYGRIGAETHREWSRPLTMSADIAARVDKLWPSHGIPMGHLAEGLPE